MPTTNWEVLVRADFVSCWGFSCCDSGIYELAHIAQVAILFSTQKQFSLRVLHLILVEDKPEYQNQQ